MTDLLLIGMGGASLAPQVIARTVGGEKLPLTQENVRIEGHAIEARIYAEDPSQDFRPAPGRISHLRVPENQKHIRVDTGVTVGDTVTAHYDPMIAKLIAWGRDRPSAMEHLKCALGETQIAGPTVNIPFLFAVARHADFDAGAVDTGFVERERCLLSTEHVGNRARGATIAAHAVAREWAATARLRAARSEDPHSPWAEATGWRLNQNRQCDVRVRDGEDTVIVEADAAVSILGEPPDIELDLDGTV